MFVHDWSFQVNTHSTSRTCAQYATCSRPFKNGVWLCLYRCRLPMVVLDTFWFASYVFYYLIDLYYLVILLFCNVYFKHFSLYWCKYKKHTNFKTALVFLVIWWSYRNVVSVICYNQVEKRYQLSVKLLSDLIKCASTFRDFYSINFKLLSESRQIVWK